MHKYVVIFFSILACSLTYAAPSEIIIVRHGDKLLQTEPGPTLSPKGEIRALNFGLYFLDKFGEPDYVFASNPAKDTSSIREIQTVAPLVNMLQARHPDQTIPIMHPYSSSDYAKLTKYILNTSDFNGKRVLICWSHGKIPALAEKLGVKEKIEKWPADDYDSVYVLHYNHKGDLKDFEVLHQQYPVKFSGSWQDLHSILMG